MPASRSRRAARRRTAGHQAQGLDIDVLAAAVEIEELTGPVLASLIRIRIAAVCRRAGHAPLSRQPPVSASDPLRTV